MGLNRRRHTIALTRVLDEAVPAFERYAREPPDDDDKVASLKARHAKAERARDDRSRKDAEVESGKTSRSLRVYRAARLGWTTDTL